MQSDPKGTLISSILEQRVLALFMEIVSGHPYPANKYEQDLLTYLEKAKTIPDVMLEARIHNILGTHYAIRGRLRAADDRYRKALDLYRAANSPQALKVQSNLAMVEKDSGKYHSAIARLHELLAVTQLSEEFSENHEQFTRYGGQSINLALVLIAVFEFGQAMEVLESLTPHYGDMILFMRQTTDPNPFIVEHRVAFGMARLALGMASDAVQDARLAASIAQSDDAAYIKLLPQLLLVRLAATESIADPLPELMGNIEQIIAKVPTLNVCSALRDEARYFDLQNQPEQAHWYIERARQVAQKLESVELLEHLDAVQRLFAPAQHVELIDG